MQLIARHPSYSQFFSRQPTRLNMDQNDDKPSTLEQWIVDSQNGDEFALNRLAAYLLPKAFEFANQKMMNVSPVDDFEDIALSAVKSVCLRCRQGQTEFLGEKELGGLLRKFVVGKIRTRRKYHFAEKRNVNRQVVDPIDSSEGSQENPDFTIQQHALENENSVWLDELSIHLPAKEQEYLEKTLEILSTDVQGLFSELVKRLDENPRKVLMLITTDSMSNKQLASALNCAPTSIERYRQAIRRKLDEIVHE